MSWETVAQLAVLMGWMWFLIAFTIQMFKKDEDTPPSSSKATAHSAPTPPPPPKKDR